jgi:ABC-type branched-subunit amino acid transport system substrate-binding protein
VTSFYARFRPRLHDSAAGRRPAPGLGRRALVAGAAGLAVALVAGCGPREVDTRPRAGAPARPAPAAAPAPSGRLAPGAAVKVALILPLSGPRAEIGQGMQRAATIAQREGNAPNMQLIVLDDGGTASGAASAMDQAVAQGAHVVLGPLLADSVRAVKDKAAAARVNVIAFTTESALAGGNVYLLNLSVRQQVESVIAYAAGKGLKRLGVIAPNDAAGNQMAQDAKEIAERYRMTVTKVGFYSATSTDINAEIQRFSGATGVDRRGRVARGALEFDAVLVPERGTKLRLVASILNYYDIDPDKVRYLGTAAWDDPAIARDQHLRGGWFAAPSPTATERFKEKYRAAGGAGDPPRIASLAYDAVALAAALARDPAGPDYSATALTNPSGFLGIDGIFRFNADGHAERGLAIHEFEKGEVKVVSEPPKSFAAGSQ